MDIDNFIDYMVTNIYCANTDWPGTNIYYWKPKKGGKWQWIFHDMDFGFARYSDIELPDGTVVDSTENYDALGMATATDGQEWPNPEWSTLILRKLLENPGFKTKFKNRLLGTLNTTFAPSRVKGIIDNIANQIESYMQRHIDRWTVNGEYSYVVHNLQEWQEQVDRLKTFADKRPAIVRSHVSQHLP